MKGNEKRKIFLSVLIVSLILLEPTLSAGPIADSFFSKINKMVNKIIEKNNQNEKMQENQDGEKEYSVCFGPPGAKSRKQCSEIIKLNETSYLNLKSDIETLKNKNLDCNETIAQLLKIFIKYNITPPCFTLENITVAVEELKTIKSKQLSLLSEVDDNSDIQIGRTTIGPHMVIYCSLLSAVVNFQPAGKIVFDRPISDIHRISDLLNISEDSSLYSLLYNVSLFHYVLYAPLEVLIGGSLGYYLSIGLFPGVQTYSIMKNPFVGVYIGWIGGGIYIYESYNVNQGVDNALFDFFIGFTPFSTVTYREFRDPIP